MGRLESHTRRLAECANTRPEWKYTVKNFVYMSIGCVVRDIMAWKQFSSPDTVSIALPRTSFVPNDKRISSIVLLDISLERHIVLSQIAECRLSTRRRWCRVWASIFARSHTRICSRHFWPTANRMTWNGILKSQVGLLLNRYLNNVHSAVFIRCNSCKSCDEIHCTVECMLHSSHTAHGWSFLFRFDCRRLHKPREGASIQSSLCACFCSAHDGGEDPCRWCSTSSEILSFALCTLCVIVNARQWIFIYDSTVDERRRRHICACRMNIKPLSTSSSAFAKKNDVIHTIYLYVSSLTSLCFIIYSHDPHCAALYSEGMQRNGTRWSRRWHML